jgi:hypothetical protein
MSVQDHVDDNMPYRSHSIPALLSRAAYCVDMMEDLYWLHQTTRPSMIARYEKHLEQLCGVVDELARRA